jgi:hypothetical protein
MDLFDLRIEPIGAGAHTHNMRCAICRDRHAVFTSPEMIFLPCWECQKQGYRTFKVRGWLWKLYDYFSKPF